jgi:hypothetical protein
VLSIIQAIMFLHQNNQLVVVHDKLCFVSNWPPASEIGMLLVTIFLELRVAAEAGRQHAVPTLFACRHPAATLPRTCRERHIGGMAGERRWNDIVCVNQTRPHCVNQMGKSQSKPLAERHGRGTAWERHGMCDSALRWSRQKTCQVGLPGRGTLIYPYDAGGPIFCGYLHTQY